MSNSKYHSELIFNLNDRLFTNALAGVTEEQANQRISDHNNPLLWLATHTVWARYNAAMLLGKPGDNPFNGMFENFKPYDVSMKLPTLDEVKKEWQKATDLLKEAITTVSEEHLNSECPLKSPTGVFTFGGTIAFLAQHESYDIGQMALLKKYYTREAMSYN
jgi:hypothetical protein